MRKEELNIILHALGLAPVNGRMPRWSQRNRYCLCPGETNTHILQKMSDDGILRLYFSANRHYWYHVTQKGMRAANVINRVKLENQYD